MHQPSEAIEELEFAIKALGLKAAMLAGHVRPIESVARKAPPEISRYAYWIDNLALDSAYDYEPVLAKCVALKMAATFHSCSSDGRIARPAIISTISRAISPRPGM